MAAQAVIDARDLSLTFTTADGPVYALQGINLTVNDGDFVSFIGPSGCGKTTLLRVIADLEQATAGTISVNGMSPAQAFAEDRRRAQEAGMNGYLTKPLDAAALVRALRVWRKK